MRSRYRGGRWCGRGDAARRPPIPIKGHRPALMSDRRPTYAFLRQSNGLGMAGLSLG